MHPLEQAFGPLNITVTAMPVSELEIVTESHAVERDRSHLTDQEQSLLKELLRPGAKIEAVIPEDSPAEGLWHALDVCVRGMGILETRMLRLRPIIGAILLIFESKPSLYKRLGYDTWSDFLKRGAYDTLGLHRTSAYEGMIVARDWKDVLTPDRYANIGPKKMSILNKVTKGSSANAETWLQAAESMKVSEFATYVETRVLGPGEATGATISFTCSRAIYDQWKGFIGDGRVQSVVGSKEPGEILAAMIAEVYNEWVCKADEQREKGRKKK